MSVTGLILRKPKGLEMEVYLADGPDQPLDQRLLQQAAQLRAAARSMTPGAARQSMLRKAREAETGAHILSWIVSPRSQRPK